MIGVIGTLVFLSLAGWGCWFMVRDARSLGETSPLARPATRGKATVVRIEDDPDRGQAPRGAWTALDDLQLTRLLTEFAPANPAPKTSIGDAVTRIEHEDTA